MPRPRKDGAPPQAAGGERGQITVKVIDPRGNELLVVRKLEKGR